jgi:DNA-binding MarR family transcriptional regulator
MQPTRQQLRADALGGIRAVVGALSRSARSVERRTGVTNAQLFVLRELAGTEGLSLSELAARSLTQQSTVSAVVARLVEQGLVRRERAKDDRRRLRLSLALAGRRVVRDAPEPATGRLLGALDRLTTRELRSLTDGLDALTSALGIEHGAPGMLFE